jgi:hypothetical protein
MMPPSDELVLQWGLVISMILYSIIGPLGFLKVWEWLTGWLGQRLEKL